ncbi:hypothetical protein EUTSA_v10022484mg [Eutrema salsugineum]|uniref:Uncharacterized protein n=1 Tax=Eutrema salsugineum TaxID=72664 RepID=V4L5A3_EUTSA|nr:hypothetical protein EUTSA_v10022484mg [Eutrema salsugineum]
MIQTMEKYDSNQSEGKISWIWSKAVSVGKKVLTAGVVLSSAPLLFPPLVKVMSSLLPANEEPGRSEKDEFTSEDSKLGRGAGTAEVYEAEPILIPIEEDEEMSKESTSLLERIREEGKTERGTSEKELQDGENSGNARSVNVQDQPGKQEAPETGREGELGVTEAFMGKDEETSSNEKMEALRKVVGYSVARSATYTEELVPIPWEDRIKLKALYVFTGVVEPPQSRLMNQDSHEIANASVRLRFLMSVIGIN